MIYVTGATGFIGSRLTRRLLERGQPVRCLVRARARGEALKQLGAELVEGDVTDRAAHELGMKGAQAAIHLAAVYEIGIVDDQAMERANIEGTRAFLAAAASTHVPKVIYTSTTVALGPVPDAATEPTDAYNGPYHSTYHRTKAYAHQLAREAQAAGMPVVIVCPSFVYGPGDYGPAGHFISDLLRGKVPALLSAPAWFSYVYVDDVVDGIIAALDGGHVGATYVLSGDAMTMNDFARRVAAVAGVRAPKLRLPVAIARPAARLLDAVARITGLRFPITREAVQTTSVDRWLHTHQRATKDLDYRPRSVDQGLPETVQWAQAELRSRH